MEGTERLRASVLAASHGARQTGAAAATSRGTRLSDAGIHEQIASMTRSAAAVTKLTDSKGRTWHVADTTGTGEFDRVEPMGSPRALFRRFTWAGERRWERQIRWYNLPVTASHDARATDAETVWRQLRASWSFDDPRSGSTAQMIQELYHRRGMGRR